MSGKCVSVTAGFLFLVGCMVGISVIMFQGDTSTSSLKAQSQGPFPTWEKSNEEISLVDRIPPMDTKSTQASSTSGQRNMTYPKRMSYSNTSEIGSTTLKPPYTSRPLSNFKLSTNSTSSTQGLYQLGSNLNPWTLSNRENEDMGFESNRLSTFGIHVNHSNGMRREGQIGIEEPGRDHWDESSEIPPDDSQVYDDDEYDGDENEDEMEEKDENSMELNELFDVANHLYASGLNSSDFQAFLRIINETMNRVNETGFLSQLNQIYSRPIVERNSDSASVGRNAYESSFTAFAFMSFGVFLLNQIHNLIGKDIGKKSQGRGLEEKSLENSDLDLLFKSPILETEERKRGVESGNFTEGRSMNSMDSIYGDGLSLPSSNYVNNMFRAMLNLVNAYTKDSHALECIWAIYCEDLDKTSANEGLYGIAARINSIGLRLIMHQISAELTMDVMMRSLLGWDGLPCKKMFPKCQAENSTTTINIATSNNTLQRQLRLPILE